MANVKDFFQTRNKKSTIFKTMLRATPFKDFHHMEYGVKPSTYFHDNDKSVVIKTAVCLFCTWFGYDDKSSQKRN